LNPSEKKGQGLSNLKNPAFLKFIGYFAGHPNFQEECLPFIIVFLYNNSKTGSNTTTSHSQTAPSVVAINILFIIG
jgi:hypothetical protein